MLEMFGSRWTDQFGTEPTPLWDQALGTLSRAQFEVAIQRLLRKGSPHPPNLPELLKLATDPTSSQTTYSAPPSVSYGERACGNWFLHHAARFRFVGMMPVQAADMREALVAIADTFTGSNAELVAALDAEAERHYPAAAAEAWLANPPPMADIVAKARDVGCAL